MAVPTLFTCFGDQATNVGFSKAMRRGMCLSEGKSALPTPHAYVARHRVLENVDRRPLLGNCNGLDFRHEGRGND